MKYFVIIFNLIFLNIGLSADDKVQQKSEWTPIKVINTEYQEFSPTISPDGKYMIFNSNRPGGLGDEDLWISNYLNGQWSEPENLAILNSPYHDQNPFITYDGQALLFSSDRDGGYGVADIYIAYKHGNTWTTPANLGPVINKDYSQSMPSLSMDNKELFFTRIPVDYDNRILKKEQIQIYYSRMENNQWTTPRQLTTPVNQLTMDCAPRIMPDNRTLVFSSARDGGAGGFDLWTVKRKNRDDPWESLTNLTNINTPMNESFFAFNITGDRLYLAANWDNGKNYDLYEYIVEKIVVDPTITLQGQITNIKNGTPVEANIVVELFAKNSEKYALKSDKINGQYSVTLPNGGDYSITVEAQGYMFYSQRFDLTKLSDSRIRNIAIALHPLEAGENIVIRTIYFDGDSYVLRDDSKLALDRIVKLLEQNKNIRLMIKGHVALTKPGGIDSQTLSEQRANSVKQYLIDHGILANRLESKGFGDSKPIGDNNTEDGRILNRRTEFEILSTN